MAKVKIAGLDGSLRNFGIALMTLDTDTLKLDIEDLKLIQTEKTKLKGVRASSDNLVRAQAISMESDRLLKDRLAVFVEVPSGGQDYNAVLGFGIVIGLYASVRPFPIEVSPSETKMAAVGTRTASKKEMNEWAYETWPEAPWRMHKRNGKMVMNEDNEHLSDAAAIVSAGIRTPAFQQTLSILRAQSGISA